MDKYHRSNSHSQIVLNKNTEDLDKYYEQRRAIQNRQAVKQENTIILDEVRAIRRDIEELKQLIQEIKNV